MNGKAAKRLRRIARELKLDPKTAYTPGGPLRRQPSFIHPETGETIEGAPIRRPGILVDCERKGYKVAKQVYKGREVSTLNAVRKEENSIYNRAQRSITDMDLSK